MNIQTGINHSWFNTRPCISGVGRAGSLVRQNILPRDRPPWFFVTSFTSESSDTRELYEELYCARGDMENRIKEQPLMLFAGRTSTHKIHSNQVRLYFYRLPTFLSRPCDGWVLWVRGWQRHSMIRSVWSCSRLEHVYVSQWERYGAPMPVVTRTT